MINNAGIEARRAAYQDTLTPCFQKPLTKAALFVIAFLLVGGAVASHFTGLGTIGITSFGIGGGLTLTLFAMSCLFTICRKQEPVREVPAGFSDLIVSNADVIPSQSVAVPRFIQSVTMDISRFSDAKLKSFTVELVKLIKENKGELSPLELANAFQPLFNQIKDNFDRISFLLGELIMILPYSASDIALVFESLVLPEEIENIDLPEHLGYRLVDTADFIERQLQMVEGRPVESFRLNYKTIFGTEVVGTHPPTLSPLLAKALGFGIRCIAEALVGLDLYHNDSWEQSQYTLGFGLEIGQCADCPFPPKVIAPLLPYLRGLSGLVKLSFSMGMSNSFETGPQSRDGFGDESAEDLLQIFETNPHLLGAQVNVSSMSPDCLANFMARWEDILNQRIAILPSIKEVLHEIASRRSEQDAHRSRS